MNSTDAVRYFPWFGKSPVFASVTGCAPIVPAMPNNAIHTMAVPTVLTEHVAAAAQTAYPVLILGAGQGGTALLEIFAGDPKVHVVGIVDLYADAPGLRLAESHGIPTFTDLDTALTAARDFANCIVFNLTRDDSLAEFAEQALGHRNVTSGLAAKLVWEIVTHLRSIRQELEESHFMLSHLARHDHLTDLPNRFQYRDRLEQCLVYAARHGHSLAVMFLDLDGFKSVNDTRGHKTGDHLLQEVAKRLRACVSGADVVARVGGDEFNFVFNDIGSRANAEQVARNIMASLASPIVVDGESCRIGGSIGIAVYPEDGPDSTSLIGAADAAMFRAKELGRNRIEFYMPELRMQMLKRAALEGALREALRQKRLRLAFQPKYSLSCAGLVVGAEALLRWHDPDLGHVSPAEFIPVAEATGLIGDVGRCVQEMLVAQVAMWRSLGLHPPPIAFNASPRCIREPDFADGLIASIEAAQLPFDALQVEITEGALLENSSGVEHNLRKLWVRGIKIAIDDFGTEYSSLAYLKRLPLSELKIDKCFVDGLGHDKNDEAIARAVLGMARALELATVAEGVETQEQAAWLAAHGCESAQGYFFARPMEVEAFEDLLAGLKP